jgi:5-formyltetrahydrofolate cyclo-ligase
MNTEPSRQLSKSELRQRARQARGQLDDQRRRSLDSAINRHLLDYAGRNGPRVVTAFVAFDGEPDLGPAMTRLERDGVRVALPVICDTAGRAIMRFRQWSPGSEMQANRYGIPEPVGTLDVQLNEIDLALIPLVAWDTRGGRLGMGASFYDRVFQPLANEERPFRMGVGYQLQQVERVPLEPWDIGLHSVLTENGCFTCPF